MKIIVRTFSFEAAHEFESFLRYWSIDFDFVESVNGEYVYTFANPGCEHSVLQSEALKIVGDNLFLFLNWKFKD